MTDAPPFLPTAAQTPLAAEIRLEAVAKSYRLPDGTRLEAIRPLSLAIEAGAIFGLVGKSGAGKSTLLRLVNLLERPDAGRVYVGGAELTALNKRALRDARQRIGMIFQHFNLLTNATVFENVAFPLRIHGRHTRAETAARVRECLEMVSISDKVSSYPAQLSGGQKQRVAIARALASAPRVLLCDEPTSALDSEATASLLAILREINRTLGITIVVVTHQLAVVDALCTRVAVLEDGAIAEEFDVGDETRLGATGLGRELLRLRSGRTSAQGAHATHGPHGTHGTNDAHPSNRPGLTGPRVSYA
jgi:D-methionine transport system ATP-binding protein